VPDTNLDEATLLDRLSHRIAEIYRAADALVGQERIEVIRKALRELEDHGCDLAE
jgi:hypothetical protein